MRAVRFDRYGDLDVLKVVEVERPRPGPGELLVRVKAAGINPGEAAIRKGLMHAIWPATFPSGEGTDLAGIVEEVEAGTKGFGVGDEVVGFTNRRASHAEYVVVQASDVVARPGRVPWEVAGALFVAGTTAYAAVRAVTLRSGERLAVSGAAGGVGSIAAQLARLADATVLGIAGPGNHAWLRSHGVAPVAYGDGLEERLRAAAGGSLDAFIDTFGGGYVDLAVRLGVRPERIDTIIDFAAAKRHGVKAEGNAAAATAPVLGELVDLIRDGKLEVPIAKVFPLDRVQDAYRELEQRHTRGKIVLVP
ncbi:MAG TPA: NADP-dependent oxidoreductase [Anaeromyxobacter sp.]